jgi:hypothetical protein
MTKEQFIEMVQGLLASGDLQSDIRGRYNYNRVAAVTNQVCSSIFAMDALFADQMAVPYEFTLSPVNGKWKGTVPVSPMNGSRGIRSLYADGALLYGNQGVTEDVLSSILKGVSSPIWSLNGLSLSLNKPMSSWTDSVEVEAYIVPNILDMDDDQEFVAMEYGEIVALKVVQIMKSNDTRPEEKINNTSQDAS